MIYALGLSLLTVLVAVTIHLFNISQLANFLIQRISSSWLRTKIVVLIAVTSHVLIAGLFAVAYIIGMKAGLGAFKSPVEVSDIFYFSLTTITTLGLGSVEPTSHLRMIAGVESATGFLLISCSAQRVFKVMTGKRQVPPKQES